MSRPFSLARTYNAADIANMPRTATYRAPASIIVLAACIALTLAASIAFMIMVPWIQTVEGAGRLIALNPGDREQAISALVPGRIAEWYVRKGDQVAEGQPIALILDNDPALLDRLGNQLDQARRRLEASVTALKTAQLDAERKADLFNDGLVSRLDMETAQIKVAEFDINVRAAQEDVNSAQVALSREGRQEVRAPRAGVITDVLGGGPATYVSAGAPLVTFIPSNIDIVVELYIDGRDIPLVEIGSQVQMQFEGWPAFQFSGWPDVSIGGFSGKVLFVEPIAQADGRFRILVTESDIGNKWPEREKLRLATPVRGWVLLEEVPVYYELWRRMNNFPPDFPGSPAGGDLSNAF